jgi:hypothetical protein
MYAIAFCWISIDIPEPTIVCGRGTGRSGIATVMAGRGAASSWLVVVVVLEGTGAADSAGFAPAPSCLLSQATETSKITDATQASERMRLD